MSKEIILPSLTLFFAIVLLLTTQRRYVGTPTRIIGGVFFIAGLLLAIFGFDHTYVFSPNKSQKPTLEDPLGTFGKSTEWGSQFTTLPTPASLTTPARIDLSQGGQSLESILQKKTPAWTLLDASKGVHSDYRQTIETHFGKLIENKNVKVPGLCWHRHSLFPLTSGECPDREAPHLLSGTDDDLTLNAEGLSTVRLKMINKAVKILITHAIPLSEPSREEGCLLGLAKQDLCIAVDNLPGTTLGALSLYSDDKLAQKVFEEFGISNEPILEKGILRYHARADHKPIVLDQPQMTKGCLGPAASNQTLVAKLNWYNSIWSNITTYKDLLKTFDLFDSQLRCGGLAQIELGASKMQKPEAAVRTLGTGLQEKLFWLTTPSSYAARLQKIADLQVGTDLKQKQVLLNARTPIYDFSFTILSPVTIEEEQGLEVSVASELNNWSLFQTGENSFKVTIPELKSQAIFNLSDFLETLVNPKLTWFTFWRTAGTKESLSIAFIFAVFLSLTQVASPSRRTRIGWSYAFLAIFILTYVIVFSSYHFSRREGGAKPFLFSMEEMQGPPHLFQRDWPDDWYKDISDRTLPVSLTEMDLNTQWKSILAGSQQRARVLSEQKLKSRLVEILPPHLPMVKMGKPTKRKVIIWDNPVARNFYFRKTLMYQLALQAWRDLADSSDNKWTIYNETSLPSGLNKDTVLVVPDLAFVNNEDLTSIGHFVASGGVLVFSDHIAPESRNIMWEHINDKYNPDFPPDFPIVLSNLGVGQTTVSYFTPIAEKGISTILTAPHLVFNDRWLNAKSFGYGSTVFLGVQPIDSKSQSVVLEIINRLRGQKYKIPDLGTDCATALLVKPFAKPQVLEDLVAKARSYQMDLKWFVDPISFAAMVPAWKDHFLAEGVVFIDDGTAYNRYLAEDLWKEFLAQNNKPDSILLLANESGEITSQNIGPKAQLVGGVLISSAQDKNLKNWRVECSQGLARPRILPHNLKATEFGLIFNNLHKDPAVPFLGYNELSKRITILNQPEIKQYKEVTFQKYSPLEFDNYGDQ